nr:MAG TPA_asm: ATP synthase E chain [Bacteriophage sp.]
MNFIVLNGMIYSSFVWGILYGFSRAYLEHG